VGRRKVDGGRDGEVLGPRVAEDEEELGDLLRATAAAADAKAGLRCIIAPRRGAELEVAVGLEVIGSGLRGGGVPHHVGARQLPRARSPRRAHGRRVVLALVGLRGGSERRKGRGGSERQRCVRT
jgi:hypothetical protein